MLVKSNLYFYGMVTVWYTVFDMKQDIEEIKRKILPILKEAGVTRSSIFGSVAHGEDTKKAILIY